MNCETEEKMKPERWQKTEAVFLEGTRMEIDFRAGKRPSYLGPILLPVSIPPAKFRRPRSSYHESKSVRHGRI